MVGNLRTAKGPKRHERMIGYQSHPGPRLSDRLPKRTLARRWMCAGKRRGEDHGMKRLLELLGVVLLLQGVAGLAHELTGRLDGWGVVARLRFLDGHEIYASVTLTVLACALFALAESRGRR